MPTIEEVITKLKENDEEAAGVVSKLLEAHDNFKTQSRRWEDQAKTNKDDAEAYRAGNKPETVTALEEQIRTLETKVSEKDQLITEKDGKLTEYEEKETRDGLVTDVATEKGIPSHLRSYLQGKTKEELESSADKLKQDFKFGEVGEFGSDGGQPKGGTLEAGKELYEEYNKN